MARRPRVPVLDFRCWTQEGRSDALHLFRGSVCHFAAGWLPILYDAAHADRRRQHVSVDRAVRDGTASWSRDSNGRLWGVRNTRLWRTMPVAVHGNGSSTRWLRSALPRFCCRGMLRTRVLRRRYVQRRLRRNLHGTERSEHGPGEDASAPGCG